MEKKRQLVLIVAIVALVAAIVMLVTLAVLSSYRSKTASSNEGINQKMSEMIEKNKDEIERLKNPGASTVEELTKAISEAVQKTVEENTPDSEVSVSFDEDELTSKISAAVDKACKEATSDAVKEISAEDVRLAIESAVKNTGSLSYNQVERITMNTMAKFTFNIAKRNDVKDLTNGVKSLSEKIQQLLNGEETAVTD